MDNFGRPVNKVPQQPPQAPQTPRPFQLRQPLQPLQPLQLPQPPEPLATPDAEVPAELPASSPAPQPIETPLRPKKSRKKTLLWILAGFSALAILSLGGLWVWYVSQLAPVNKDDTQKQLVAIVAGSTPTEIADTLKENDLIRSQTAFLWYTRFEGVQNSLQAGTYRLSKSESTQDIVKHLTNGTVDTFDITFIPGETLAKNREVFLKAGYSAEEVDTAFKAQYTSSLFEGKPATADLEGFIYPDTYRFGAGATVESILEHIFDTYNKAIETNNLKAKFKAQGLTLFEGITMASIIQKEAVGGDERQIAQVFLKRYSIGMKLGSDPTYQYITDKLGVPRDLNYDSPYNTRRYEGIPPGPIANPGLIALKAVGDPASGDYLYFLSGDDDVTYFSRTFEEHEQNIVDHCKIKCQAI